jgi:class 3 adenylate cyclase
MTDSPNALAPFARDHIIPPELLPNLPPCAVAAGSTQNLSGNAASSSHGVSPVTSAPPLFFAGSDDALDGGGYFANTDADGFGTVSSSAQRADASDAAIDASRSHEGVRQALPRVQSRGSGLWGTGPAAPAAAGATPGGFLGFGATARNSAASLSYSPPSIHSFDIDEIISRNVSASGVSPTTKEQRDMEEAELDDLFSPKARPGKLQRYRLLWILRYLDHEVEEHFILFTQRQRFFGLTSFISGCLWFSSAATPQRGYRIETFALMFYSFFLFLLHLWNSSRAESAKTHAAKVKCSTFQEGLGVALMLAGVVIGLDMSDRGSRCVVGLQNRSGCTQELARHVCTQLWSFPILFMLFPVSFVDIRQSYSFPSALAIGVSIVLSYWSGANTVETRIELLTKTVISVWLTLGCLYCILLLEGAHRNQFDFWVGTKRKIRKIASQRSGLDTALQNVLPLSYLSRLKSNLPVIHTSSACTVSVFQIFDFARWSYTLLPKIVVETIDIFYTILDRVILDFGVNKVKTVGDRYISSVGLAISHDEEGLTHNPASLIHLALFSLNVGQRIQGALGAGYTFDLQVGVHTGQCVGGIIGTYSLWFEIFGEGFDTAARIVDLAPRNHILVTEATMNAVQSNFICVASDLECDALHVGKTYLVLASDEEHAGEDVDQQLPAPAAAPPTTDVGLGDAQQPATDPTPVAASTTPLSDGVGEAIASRARREILASRVRLQMQKTDRPVLTEAGLTFFDMEEFTSDHLRLDLVDEQLRIVQRPWRELRFAYDHVEQKYRQYQHFFTEEPTGIHGSSFAFLILCISVLTSGLVEGNHTVESFVLSAASVVILIARIAHRRKCAAPKRELWVGAIVLTNTFAANYMMEPGISNGGFSWLQAAATTGSLWFFIGLQYTTVVAIFVSILLCSLMCDYFHRDHKALFYDAFPGAIYGLTTSLCAFYNELKIRHQYRDLAKSRAIEQASECELLMTTTLLDMIVPRYVVKAVVEKCNGGTGKAIVHSLGDVCVAAVRFDRFSSNLIARFGNSQSLIQYVENHFTNIERTIEVFGKGLLTKVHAVGDTVLIGGPFKEPDPKAMRLPISYTADVPKRDDDLQRIHEEAEDTLLQAAQKLLDMILDLRFAERRGMTAILCVGSGFAAVTGIRRPAFDVLGLVTRTAFELLDEAPERNGFVAIQESFAKLLELGRVRLPRRALDFSLGERMRWRLRGSGVVYVVPLHVPQNYEALLHE